MAKSKKLKTKKATSIENQTVKETGSPEDMNEEYSSTNESGNDEVEAMSEEEGEQIEEEEDSEGDDEEQIGEEEDSEGNDEEQIEEEEDSEGDEEESGEEEEGDDSNESEEEEEEDEGYVEPTPKQKSKPKKHVLFDDDDTFEDLPHLPETKKEIQTEAMEESDDSDAPPDEGSISKVKDSFAEDNIKLKKELVLLKKQVKEARRLKHERNREQQMKKRERLQKLEDSRLPMDLLAAVESEQKQIADQIISKKVSGKRKTFDIDVKDSNKKSKKKKAPVDEVIPLEKGINVRTVIQEVKKQKSIASPALKFRQKAMYGKKYPRMTSEDQRKMSIKKQKSGKATRSS